VGEGSPNRLLVKLVSVAEKAGSSNASVEGDSRMGGGGLELFVVVAGVARRGRPNAAEIPLSSRCKIQRRED
jgi:hypothetical protein